ncbi:hypothetical protein AGR8A_pTi10096 [Agrobacterium fabrum str. J-07]|nr:hypothetical protein AGR8A_pTi10096 [Agrobacterium fabrum str. J-07]
MDTMVEALRHPEALAAHLNGGDASRRFLNFLWDGRPQAL